ncbi:uncharacterized protein LOC128547484 [Mercenaria mercenaria]|uniref:uncharacterized protein LOC128547484 n=1 Tax=Mercenaria mercenaria TaxID=6596 RepID=UPI00234EEE9B|nr:uncharacterized protein LOC128547484 [Mercenaria mercenaria]
MRDCNDNVPIWRVVIPFIVFLSVYLYLYTNAFYGMQTSPVFLVDERDLQAVRKNKFGSVTQFLKLIEQSDESLTIEVPASDLKSTSTTTKPTTKAKQTQNMSARENTKMVEKYKSEILLNNSEPLLTLFTSWKDSPEKYLLHNLTLYNWVALRPFVIPVIFTNEISVAEECARNGWEVRHVYVTAADGVPVLKYMYKDVMNSYNSTFYAYTNGDILFTDTLIQTLLCLRNSSLNLDKPVLMVGKRTNVLNVTESEGSTWVNITKMVEERGQLFTGWAEEYFISTRSFPWSDIADVVIGRRAYDNWLVYYSRKSKYTVIDSTKTLLAVHQTTKAGNHEGHGHTNKDYNHNLLVKIYKRIKYNLGVIECVEKYTAYENGIAVVKSRVVRTSCMT